MKVVHTILLVLLLGLVLRIIISNINRHRNLRFAHGHAVITGASSGIGEAFATYLARRCSKLTIVSRRVEELTRVKQQLYVINPAVDVVVFPADLSKDEDIARLTEYIRENPAGLFMNCAGIIQDFAPLTKLNPSQVKSILQLHVAAATKLLRAVQNLFIQDIGNQKHTYIQVASASALFTFPYAAVYSASKAYLVQLFRSLAAETQNDIQFVALTPLTVSTKMSLGLKLWPVIISPRSFVIAAMNSNWSNAVLNPHLSHVLQVFLVQLIPERILRTLLMGLMRVAAMYVQWRRAK